MRDFNFFEYFEQKGKQQKGRRVSYPILLLVIVVAATAWPLTNIVRIHWMQRTAENRQHQLETDERYPLLTEVDELHAELEEERNRLAELENAAEQIKNREIIDEQLLFTIASSMPADTSLSSLTINQSEVRMTGNALSKPAIAELEHNLRRTGQFEEIFVPSISENDGEWQFQIAYQVAGGEEE